MEEVLSIHVRREPLVKQLLDGASRKAELVEAVDVSRSTVDRGVRELEDAGLATRDERGYRLTLYGKLAHEEFEAFVTRYESLSAAKDLLAQLPPDAEIDFRIVEGANVISAGERGAVEPYRRVEEIVESAAEIRATSPIVLPSYVDLFVRVVERGADVTLMFDPAVLDVLASSYPGEWEIVDRADNCTVLETCDVPPYELVLADEAVWLGVYGDEGNLVGGLYNGTQAAVEWAEAVLSGVCEVGERNDDGEGVRS